MVFQNYALYPHMTVFENMAFGLKLRKTPKDEIKRRVDEAARILDIAHLLDRKPKALSGGQRQRVALGRAIVREPKVFLLDEPLSNLDAKLRAQMRTELSKLHKRLGTTFIYVTHDQTEAMTMADRIVVMKDGFIQQVDTPQHLYDMPCNMFVAGFIGSPQMNFIESKLLKEGGTFYVEFGSEDTKTTRGVKYRIPLPAEKDWTDLQAAYELAVSRGAKDIIFTGCTGGRQDHHLSAVQLLETAARQGVRARILDPWNCIEFLLPGTHCVWKQDYTYFSLIPVDRLLEHVTIRGAKYPLLDRTTRRGDSLTVSNEWVEDPATVSFTGGCCYLIHSVNPR